MSFVKLHHKLLNWGWADDPNMVALWVRILLEANWKDEEWHGTLYERGSFPTSYTKLSQDTGLSVQSVRTCLERLKKSGEITCVSTNVGTKIIVNKWDYYQGSCDDANTPDNTPATSDQHEANTEPTRDQHDSNTKPTTLKEYKNIKNTRSKEKEIYKESLDCSPEFAEALEAYEEMRKKIRKPLTVKAKQMVLKKLESMAPDEETQIAILNQSTMNSWQGIFPLQDQRRNGGMSIDIMNL